MRTPEQERTTLYKRPTRAAGNAEPVVAHNLAPSAAQIEELTRAFFTISFAVTERALGASQVEPKAVEDIRSRLRVAIDAVRAKAATHGLSSLGVEAVVTALVAFADESIRQQPVLADHWGPGNSLQAAVLGHEEAGERFFVALEQLPTRLHGAELSCVRRVFLLCLLFGFVGRYQGSHYRGLLASVISKLRNELREPEAVPLAPEALPKPASLPRAAAPWPALRFGVVLMGLSALAHGVFWLLLTYEAMGLQRHAHELTTSQTSIDARSES